MSDEMDVELKAYRAIDDVSAQRYGAGFCRGGSMERQRLIRAIEDISKTFDFDKEWCRDLVTEGEYAQFLAGFGDCVARRPNAWQESRVREER